MPQQHFTRVQHQYTTRVYRVQLLHAWYTRVQHTTRVVHVCTAYYTRVHARCDATRVVV